MFWPYAMVAALDRLGLGWSIPAFGKTPRSQPRSPRSTTLTWTCYRLPRGRRSTLRGNGFGAVPAQRRWNTAVARFVSLVRRTSGVGPQAELWDNWCAPRVRHEPSTRQQATPTDLHTGEDSHPRTEESTVDRNLAPAPDTLTVAVGWFRERTVYYRSWYCSVCELVIS